MPTNLNNLKSKVDKLNIDKLKPVPAGLSKLSNVEKNDSAEKSEYNAKMKNIEDKIPHVTNLATKTTLKAKLNPEIPSITNLATNSCLTAVENKLPNVSNLVRKTDYNTKINKIRKKITDQLTVNSRIFCCKISTGKFSNKDRF